jgi:hypothetical protein
MNVIVDIHDKEYVLGLREAKKVLNDTYNGYDHVVINDDKIEVDRITRDEIKKQLHGQIYV